MCTCVYINNVYAKLFITVLFLCCVNCLNVMRCAIWYQALFGVCMVVRTHADAC